MQPTAHPSEITGAEEDVTSQSVILVLNELDMFAAHARQTDVAERATGMCTAAVKTEGGDRGVHGQEYGKMTMREVGRKDPETGEGDTVEECERR